MRRAAVAAIATAAILGCALANASAQTPSEPRIDAPSQVAVGGVLRIRISGAGPGAVLERQDGRGWSVGRRVPVNGRFALRVRDRGVQALRVRTVDGGLSAVTRTVVRPLVLAAGGDVNLGDVPGRLIAARGAAYPWTSVGAVLRAADLAFVNLECAVSRRGRPERKQFTFRGTPRALAGARRAAGLDVVNLANNHAGDYGRTALLDTIRHARANGIVPVGAGADDRAAYVPRIVERLGLRVAFVGFSEILPFDFRSGPRRPGTAWAFPGGVRAAVRRASREADVVIAAFHWGIERDTSPSPGQRSLASIALRAGATAVLGAHPHVLQPVERVGSRRLVAYSLGNFVFGANSPGTERTAVLLLGLGARRVIGHRLLPARISAGRPVLSDPFGTFETVGVVQPFSR